MAKVKLYTTQYCPYCTRAKSLLQAKKADFEEIDVTDDADTRQKVADQTGWMTVPMIFIGNEFVGGYDELSALDAAGKLDAKLAG